MGVAVGGKLGLRGFMLMLMQDGPHFCWEVAKVTQILRRWSKKVGSKRWRTLLPASSPTFAYGRAPAW